jgi:hypothetical protein
LQADSNADLCAAKSYYDTLVAHGVDAELVLLKPEFASSYCMGNSTNPAAAGSPYMDKTASAPPPPPRHHSFFGNTCIDHTMGFADVVEPLTKFLLKTLAALQ